MIYWTELWVAVLTAGLAFALWRQRRLTRELREKTEGMAKALTFKRDKRPFTQRPRARRVDTVFHDRDDEGREHWLCVNCGASVPQMGHTVKACEDFKFAEMRREQDAEAEKAKGAEPHLKALAEDAAKAAHAVATGGIELPTPYPNYVAAKPRQDTETGIVVGYNCVDCGDDVPREGHSYRRCAEVSAELAKGSNTETV